MNTETPPSSLFDTQKKLAYAGLLPFAIALCVPWIWAAHEQWWFNAFCLYSAMILAFLAGGVWGQLLSRQAGKAERAPFVWSNMLTLLAASSFLMPAVAQILCLAASYWLLMKVEKRYSFAHYSADYGQLRERLNGAVMGAHLLMIFNALAL